WFYNDFAGIGFSAYLNYANAFGANLAQYVFVGLGAALFFFALFVSSQPGPRRRQAAAVLAVAGAAGNTFDRLKHGAVVDWLGPGWIGPVDFPIACILADLFLFGSALLFLLRSWRPQLRISDPQ